MVKRDLTVIFSVILTKRGVAVMALRQGGYPHATGSSCWPQYPMGQWWSLCFGISTPKAFPFFSYTKRKKRIWSLGCPRAGGFTKLSFRALKTMSSVSSLKISLRFLLLSKTYRGLAIGEKFGIQFQQ